MAFIVGARTLRKPLPPEHKVCPTCLSVTEHTVLDEDTQFTLYFIPLFSIKRDVVYTCTQCEDTHTIPYSDYQAAHSTATHIGEQPGRRAARQNNAAQKAKTAREKTYSTLEGKIVNGQIKTSLPLRARLSADQILKWLWIVFIVIAGLAIILLTGLIAITSR